MDGQMTADKLLETVGHVPKSVYIVSGWSDSIAVQGAANEFFEGIQDHGEEHPGYVVLEHHSSFGRWYAIVNRDLAKEGVFPTEYMVVSR